MADRSPLLDSPSSSSPSLGTRLRAHSHSVWEKVRRSPSRGSEGGRSSVSQALGQAGVLSGSIGLPFDPQSLQDVKSGASVFLQELERVASRPAGPSRTGTIEVEIDDPSSEGVHPICSAPSNPFTVTSDNASDRSYDFTETIKVIRDDKEHSMRALLDTGMLMNAIHYDMAVRSNFTILEYTGNRLKDADGPEFDPIGKVQLQFYFKSYRSAKSWPVEFIVLKDPPFDVALGSTFIKSAGLLKQSDPILPMAFKDQTKEEKREQKDETTKRDAYSEQKKEEEKRKWDERRRIEQEKKKKERDKKGR